MGNGGIIFISQDQAQFCSSRQEDLTSLGISPEDVFVVTGAQGALGQTYLRVLAQLVNDRNRVVGLHRRELDGSEVPSEKVSYRQVDLLKEEEIEKVLADLSLNGTKRITIIHTAGLFKLEPDGVPEIDHDGDGFDDEVIQANCQTTENIITALSSLQKDRGINLSLVAFDSIIRPHGFPYFRSYDRAKELMCQKLKETIGTIPGLGITIFQIPTLNTGKERDIRPFAQDTEHWLKPSSLVLCSLDLMLNNEYAEGCREVSVYVECPGFSLEQFVRQHPDRWQQETGMRFSCMRGECFPTGGGREIK